MTRHLVRNLIVNRGTTHLHQIPSCPRNATYHNTFSVNIHFIHSRIYIAHLHENYSEVLSTPARSKQTVHNPNPNPYPNPKQLLLISGAITVIFLDGFKRRCKEFHIKDRQFGVMENTQSSNTV